MYAYDTGPSRRTRDVPPSSSNRYRDTGLYDYAQPARSSKRYQDPEPSAPSSYDRHRRKSVPINMEKGRSSRHANVVASDDGRVSRDTYGSSYPERSSRHDAEAKTSDGHRHFREQRRGYETEEAANLKRAKSHSPRRAAREAEVPRHASPQAPSKSAWADDAYNGYTADPYHASNKKGRGQQYYGEDVNTGRGGSRDHAKADKDYLYGSSPAGMPRPPAGDYASYKPSPLSTSAPPEDKVYKHSREHRARDKPSHSSAYPEYEPYEPPRRARSNRVPEEPSGYDDYGYGAPPRGRDRPPPARDYEDPYDRTARGRQRQSVPPQARSRYPEYEDDYGVPPRRAASMNQGRHRGYDAPSKKAYPDERSGSGTRTNANAEASASRSTGSTSKNKQKKWGKQAGKLFMTHAVPVIKQEAVPFLTKAAQAYMEQKKH